MWRLVLYFTSANCYQNCGGKRKGQWEEEENKLINKNSSTYKSKMLLFLTEIQLSSVT